MQIIVVIVVLGLIAMAAKAAMTPTNGAPKVGTGGGGHAPDSDERHPGTTFPPRGPDEA